MQERWKGKDSFCVPCLSVGNFKASHGPKPTWDFYCPWLCPLAPLSASDHTASLLHTYKSSLPLLSTPTGVLSISGLRYCNGFCLLPLPPAWPHSRPLSNLPERSFRSIFRVMSLPYLSVQSPNSLRWHLSRSPPCLYTPWDSKLVEGNVYIFFTVYLQLLVQKSSTQ